MGSINTLKEVLPARLVNCVVKAGPEFLRRVKQLGFCDRPALVLSPWRPCLEADWQGRGCIGAEHHGAARRLGREALREAGGHSCGGVPGADVPRRLAGAALLRNYLYLSYVGEQNDVVPLRSEKLAAHKASLELRSQKPP